METLEYPFRASFSGDLALTTTEEQRYESRARLLLDVKVGQRPMLERFGSNVRPFEPNSTSNALEAALLGFQLNTWCVDDNEAILYAVTALDTLRNDFLELDIRINGVQFT